MALQAYPDVPLFRYPFTQLTAAQVQAKLAGPARGGPGSKGPLETDLAGTNLRVVTDGAGTLSWQFGQGNKVSFEGAEAGYGALTLDHVTLISHLVPDSTRGYAIAWDRHSNLATVFELWFGGGPSPHDREVNRAVWHGYVQSGDSEPPTERHAPTLRLEGRAFAWTEDTGNRTIEYYPSVTYTHWVELDRLKGKRGYSAPMDYIQLTEDLYLVARVESEFSGLLHMYLVDVNRLLQAGLRLGFNGADELEYYMFRGTGEWLGQLARFEKLGDFSAEPLKIENAKKGERRIYRPVATMDKMTPAEVAKVVAENTHVFDRPSPMAGNGTKPSGDLAGKAFAIHYDDGPQMEYRFTTADSLQWRRNGAGDWKEARYNAWEVMPGAFIFGHLLQGEPNHDGHIAVIDLDAGLATNYHGFLNTPYFANEAGAETLFGKIVGQGIPDPGTKRHERTSDLLGRAFTWEYSPGLNSMHLYSTPNTTSWIIPTPTGHFATEWSGSGDFVKIRDQLYFARWQEEACNGTLGTILINMRTMHDAGIGYHCGKNGLSMSAVGAPARHAGKFNVDKFFPAA
ncbi:MoaF N-terminal domain-containing protein [Croceibacterium sp. LX-88]|uniref:MoaF N-terminal domain-containing protein n=1 Tax=Croceibacterium selenioxidans TaxID=2838833 RepID=A0ABS5W381_9SPHN|nr:MoaF N-terminal domain-containing protein [Croceibacterium selenioxidans]MBT2134216.1 MoaF N-terminal domain-containing protein [Croceibacterium selenioxidans]